MLELKSKGTDGSDSATPEKRREAEKTPKEWERMQKEELLAELRKLWEGKKKLEQESERQKEAGLRRMEQLLVTAIDAKQTLIQERERFEREKQIWRKEHKRELERVLTLAIEENYELRQERDQLKEQMQKLLRTANHSSS